MRNICIIRIIKLLYRSVLLILLMAANASSQGEIIDFESGRWTKQGRITEYLGQKCFMGRAILKDVDFANGVIEADMAFDGRRTFGHIFFRMQSDDNFENFYIRPHKTGLNDAQQYQAIFNGQSSWQLYSNKGFTAPAQIPHKRWMHVKMEIFGTQAQIYLDNSEEPTLIVTNLKHGESSGWIGVSTDMNGSAYVANFSYQPDNTLSFDDPPKFETPYGMFTGWKLSQTFKLSRIDMRHYPDNDFLSEITWQDVKSEHSGMVNIARYVTRTGAEPDCIYAKTVIEADNDEIRTITFGYSDAVVVFLNGQILFTGNSSFRLRDPAFLGIVGLFDSVSLPLRKGRNELMLLVAESMGGWGFICKDADAVYMDKKLEKAWKTGRKFKYPESIAFDRINNCLYVTNYDAYNRSMTKGINYISKVSLDGKIEEEKWGEGLYNPTGMIILQDRLYVVERNNVVEIDITSGQITKRYPVQGAGFINDIAADREGNLYISDSGRHIIYKITGGAVETWLKNEQIISPNGLFIHDGKLLIGCGDNYLKSVDLSSKKIDVIANLGPGIIDGIKLDSDGNYLVSHYEGELFRINPQGNISKLMDTTAPNERCADFCYIPEKNMLIIPTMENCVLKAYRIK